MRPRVLDTNFVFHYNCVMKNVTITLDEEVARWVRVYAAERDTSVSRLVGELLREEMLSKDNYETAMDRYLSRAPLVLKKKSARYPGREKLHDRRGFR